VIDEVDRLNLEDADGKPMVRIHAIGFPVIFSAFGAGEVTGVRFTTLMRELCRRNGGTFVSRNSLRP